MLTQEGSRAHMFPSQLACTVIITETEIEVGEHGGGGLRAKPPPLTPCMTSLLSPQQNQMVNSFSGSVGTSPSMRPHGVSLRLPPQGPRLVPTSTLGTDAGEDIDEPSVDMEQLRRLEEEEMESALGAGLGSGSWELPV